MSRRAAIILATSAATAACMGTTPTPPRAAKTVPVPTSGAEEQEPRPVNPLRPGPGLAPSTTSTTVTVTTSAGVVTFALPEAAGDESDLEWLVRQTWPEDPDTAVRVIACESHWNPWATGRQGERGLAQIHPIHRARVEAMGLTWDDMFDPLANLRVARAIWEESGWAPWSCAA